MFWENYSVLKFCLKGKNQKEDFFWGFQDLKVNENCCHVQEKMAQLCFVCFVVRKKEQSMEGKDFALLITEASEVWRIDFVWQSLSSYSDWSCGIFSLCVVSTMFVQREKYLNQRFCFSYLSIRLGFPLWRLVIFQKLPQDSEMYISVTVTEGYSRLRQILNHQNAQVF